MRNRLAAAAIVAAVVVVGLLVARFEVRPGSPAPSTGLVSDLATAPRQDDPPLVDAELVADIEIIQPGARFRLGVMLTVASGWHVHWTNPGPSGEPTTIELRLPNGFTSGPLKWPTPRRFSHPDGTVAFGYGDRVLVQADVRASNLDPEHDWRLQARASWMVCADECRSGAAAPELWLPPSISGTRLIDNINVDVFDEWERRLPIERTPPPRPITVTTRPAPSGAQVVSIYWNFTPTEVEWFPTRPTLDAFGLLEAQTAGRHTRLSVPAAPDAGAPHDGARVTVDAIEGVLAFGSPTSARRSIRLSVPRVGASGG